MHLKIWGFYIIKGITSVFSVVATALKNHYKNLDDKNLQKGKKKPFMNPLTSK